MRVTVIRQNNTQTLENLINLEFERIHRECPADMYYKTAVASHIITGNFHTVIITYSYLDEGYLGE